MNPNTLGRRRESVLVLIVWGCFLARGFFFAGIIPVWEGYDEWAHFAYVQHLLAHGTLPVASGTRVSREIEASLDLLPLPWEQRDRAFPAVTHDAWWRMPAEERAERSRRLRSLPRDWERETAVADVLLYEAQQPPLYYWLLKAPLYLMAAAPLPERVFLLRCLSLLMASIVVPVGYRLARRAFRDRAAAIGVVAVITAMPEFLLELSRVANDSLATALFSILLLLAVRIANEPDRARWFAAYGLTLGLGLLAKAYFLTAIPATALLLLWLLLRAPAHRTRILKHGILAAATALAIAGWWYVRNHAMTGAWSGLGQDVALRTVSPAALLRRIPDVDWRVAFDGFLVSHIYFGNWSFLQLRWWIYHYFLYLGLAVAAGFGIFASRYLWKGRSRASAIGDARPVFVSFLFYAVFAAGLAYHVLITFAAGGGSSTGGWYIYCLVIAEVLLAAAGAMAILPRRLRPWVLPFLTGSFALLDLYATHLVLIPYYTGLIAHNPNGALATFHIGQYSMDGIGLAVQRLVQNRPAFWNETVLIAAWFAFLAATFGTVAASVLRRPGAPGAGEQDAH